MNLLDFFKKNEKDQKKQIESRYASGAALLKNGRIEEALIQFQILLRLNSNHTLAHYHVGEIYYKKEMYETALIHFEQALKTSESKTEASNIHIALAITFFSLGQLEQAIQEFKKALRLNPKRRDLHLDIGELYYQLGEIDKAINHFQQTDQGDATAQLYLAKAYWTKNDHQKSLHLLREASNNFPKNSEIHAYLGYLLLEKGAYRDAIDVLRNAFELSKKPDEKLFANLGDAYYEFGDLEEALKIYNQARDIFPDNQTFHKKVGFIYKEQNDLAKAIEVWKHMVEIDKLNPEAHTTLAFGLRLSGNFEAALNEIQQAFEANVNYAPAYASQGNIFLDMGKTETAIASFKQAVKLGDSWGLLDLANIYQELGNTSEAANYAQAFIEAARKNPDLSEGVEEATAILDTSRE